MIDRSGALVLIAALLVSGVTDGAETLASTARPSREQPTTIERSDEQQARDWGLRSDEWTRYRELMRGPLGIYSPNLDPLTALGIEARSAEEQRRFAELQVQAETRRVEKLLAYQRAYDAAWQRLNPGMPRVALPDAGAAFSSAVPAAGERLAVFVKDACTACDHAVQQLQAAGIGFDLYLVGSRNDDARIRTWARRIGIDPAKVSNRMITLNHDAGRWLLLSLPGELPAVLSKVNGQWQRQ